MPRPVSYGVVLMAALALAGCQPPSAVPGPTAGPRLLPSVSLDFAAFETSQASLETTEAFRVYGPGATLKADVEPEYLAVSADSKTAWVTLQENNGLARIDLAEIPAVSWVHGLGLQDFGREENATDLKDDGLTSVAVRPHLVGFFLPDGVARVTVGGIDYLLMANEGDLREYPGFNEEGLVGYVGDPKLVTLAPALFSLEARTAMVELSVTRTPFSPAFQATDLETVYTLGGRSFSVRRADTGALVWDSGNDLDELARINGSYQDERSDEKSSEPESVTTGTVDGGVLGFVGLEKASAVAVYDLSQPAAPVFRQWLSRPGDVGPEGLLFIPAADSPSGRPLLVTSNEKSGTVTVWQSGVSGGFSWASTIDLGSVGDAEITAYDPASRRLFSVCNTEKPYSSRVEVTQLGADLGLVRLTTLPIKEFGYGVNSVSAHGGFVAAAVEGFQKTERGQVLVWKADTLVLVAQAPTGALPDMVTFTPDGLRILTADEGEPSLDYTLDPPGSVTIIDARGLY